MDPVARSCKKIKISQAQEINNLTEEWEREREIGLYIWCHRIIWKGASSFVMCVESKTWFWIRRWIRLGGTNIITSDCAIFKTHLIKTKNLTNIAFLSVFKRKKKSINAEVSQRNYSLDWSTHHKWVLGVWIPRQAFNLRSDWPLKTRMRRCSPILLQMYNHGKSTSFNTLKAI